MNILPIATKTKKTSNVLLNSIRRRSSLNRMYEKKTLELLKKSIEERGKTYSALSKRDKQGGGLLGNLLGGSLLLRRLRGRGPKGPGSIGPGGIRPKSPIRPRGGGTIGGGVSRLGRFSRIGPLAVLGTGLDFAGRVGSGQNIAQATIGAGGGLAGALAGGAKGAAIGTAIGGPLGTLIGGVGGSILGGFAGGSIADLLTGASDNRRRQQIQQIGQSTEKSKFSKSLDKFDNVIDNFEGSTTPLIKDYKANKGVAKKDGPLGFVRRQAPGLAIGAVVGTVLATIGTELAITAALAVAPVPGTRFAAVYRLARKIPLLGRIGRFLLRILPATRGIREVGGGIARKLPAPRIIKKVFGPKSTVSPGQLNLGIKTPRIKTPKFQQLNIKDLQIQRQTKLMTDSINRKFRSSSRPVNPNNLVDRNNQLMLGRNQIDSDGFYKITRSGPGLKDSKISTDKFLKNTPNPKTIDRMSKELGLGKKTFEPDFGKGIEKAGPDDVPNVSNIFKQLEGRAEGGRVEAGTPYMVGELGKELFVPDVSGDIVPNDQLGPSIIAMTSDPDTITKSSGGGGGNSGGGSSSLPANPYAVVTKYAQMTGLFTV